MTPRSHVSPPTTEESTRVVLREGMVVDARDATEGSVQQADVAISDGIIQAVGEITPQLGDEVLDASGRYVMPGFIDTHSHAEGAILEPRAQKALLRQGITTIIGDQDGVSYAPGDGPYGSQYFAAINGPHPTYTGGGVGALLKTYDHTSPINVGYLVPASTVRYEIMGHGEQPPRGDEISRMRDLVAEGIEQGALGLSTGLDYVPGIFADAEESAALAAVAGLYVTHLRGGYEAVTDVGVSEIIEIAQGSDVPVHIAPARDPRDHRPRAAALPPSWR